MRMRMRKRIVCVDVNVSAYVTVKWMLLTNVVLALDVD